MSITAAIRKMLAAGLTIEQALIAADAFEEATKPPEPPAVVFNAAAERQRRYRERKALQKGADEKPITKVSRSVTRVTKTVTRDTLKHHETLQDVTRDAQESSPLVPPSLLPEPLNPPPYNPPSVVESCDPPPFQLSVVGGGDPVTAAFMAYNELAKRLSLPKAISLTPVRRQKIASRLKRYGIEGWTAALNAIEASRHCRGINDRGWVADLDFLFQEKSWNRLLEGSYGRDFKEGDDAQRLNGLAPATAAGTKRLDGLRGVHEAAARLAARRDGREGSS